MIRGILFDKDGTLFDFAGTWKGWFENVLADLAGEDIRLKQRLAQACGYQPDTGGFIPDSLIVSGTSSQVNQALSACADGLTEAKVDHITRQHLQSLPYAPVCDLRLVFGELLRQGITLGVATNDTETSAHKQLSDAGVVDQLAFICGSDSGFGGKPGNGMALAFCAQTGLKPAEIAVVGDAGHDLEAGRSTGAGLNIAVLTGPATRQQLEPLADLILPDISYLATPELQKILRGQKG